jgi:hypothetical protein
MRVEEELRRKFDECLQKVDMPEVWLVSLALWAFLLEPPDRQIELIRKVYGESAVGSLHQSLGGENILHGLIDPQRLQGSRPSRPKKHQKTVVAG